MILWGGTNGNNLNTGGRHDPNTNSWPGTSTTNAPTPRGVPAVHVLTAAGDTLRKIVVCALAALWPLANSVVVYSGPR